MKQQPLTDTERSLLVVMYNFTQKNPLTFSLPN